MLKNLFQARFDSNRSKHPRDREYLRALSMHPNVAYDDIASKRHHQFSRLLSNDRDMRSMGNAAMYNTPPSKEEIMRILDQFRDDFEDDADDEDDDDVEETTPTVECAAPKFP